MLRRIGFVKSFSISQISLLISLGFLFGIASKSLFVFETKWALLVTVLIFVNEIFSKSKRKGRLLFLACGFFLATLRMQVVLSENFSEEIDFTGEVKVEELVEHTEDYQRIYSSFKSKDGDKGFLIFAKTKPTLKYGDLLKVDCRMKIPENRHKKFNYRRFLASKKVFYICSSPKITKLSSDEGFGLKMSIFKIRELFEKKINALFPQTEGAYLAGLLLGGDDRLPEDVAENFRVTGTLHTVAVSGYNITIIASILMWFSIAIGFWRKQAFYLAVIGIIVFVVMIGAPTSATRAAVMGVLMLWAMQRGRLANSFEIIVFTATSMVAISPFILLYDPGFQLSFLATLGIVCVYSPLAKLAKIERDFLELKSIILVTVSAQLGVLGVLVYTFEAISVISIFANLVILPLIPLIMLLGFVGISISFIFPMLGSYASLLAWALLKIEVVTIDLLARIPYANLELGDIGLWWLILYYLFFVGFVFRLREMENKKI